MTTTMGSLDLSALNNLYDETQYFWFESSAQPWGAGAHVTLYPQSEFTTSTHANYLKGQNILMNTDGFSLRNGTLPMMTLDNDSLDFNVVNTTTGTYETTATFTATSARIGANTNGQTRTEISPSGIDFIRKNDSTSTDYTLAHIGYGTGTAQSGTATAPYYTLGERSINSTIGNYSMAEGRDVISSGYVSHAEGTKTKASGNFSHAEGNYTTASGNDSHAEGNITKASGNDSHAEGWSTTASGNYSHAEGAGTTASGDYSHAEGRGTTASNGYSHAEGRYTQASGENSHSQNEYTIAQGQNQTVIGMWNEAQGSPSSIANTDHAFIIGNGTNIRSSNALTVDWSGNVNIASGAHYKINGTNLAASDVSAVALSDKYTRSSVGTLDWTNQTDGDAKVIAKSALAFWNGAYSGTNSNLSYCSAGRIVGRNQICYANSRVNSFSSGSYTATLSSFGVTTGAKPVGIILTPESSSAIIMKYNYDSSDSSNIIIQAWNHDGSAFNGNLRYFAVVFQNTWTST